MPNFAEPPAELSAEPLGSGDARHAGERTAPFLQMPAQGDRVAGGHDAVTPAQQSAHSGTRRYQAGAVRRWGPVALPGLRVPTTVMPFFARVRSSLTPCWPPPATISSTGAHNAGLPEHQRVPRYAGLRKACDRS